MGHRPGLHRCGDRARVRRRAVLGLASANGARPDVGAFFGAYGRPDTPAALLSAQGLNGKTGAGLDPCFALQQTVAVSAAAPAEVTLVLGAGETAAAARAAVTGNYAHKGHMFVELDVGVLCDGAVIARVAHTAIWKPRQVS